jgi:hypothetical protein
MKPPLLLVSRATASETDATDAAGCSRWSEASPAGSSVDDDDDDNLLLLLCCSSFETLLCADAERRRNIGKNPEDKDAPPPSSRAGDDKDEEVEDAVDSLRDPAGVLIGLRANTGTSEKCSEGIRIYR